MLGTVIKKEILDNLLSHKFLFVFILCSALTLFSIYIGASDYVESKREYDVNVSALRERMQPPQDLNFFNEYEGYRIFREPQVLRTIVAGVEDAAGRTSYPNQLYENNLTESKYESNTIFTLFGSLDLMFVIKFVFSLCAVFLTYEVVSGEKEKGTLKLTLSNSVSRNQLIAGKVIGNYISMLLLFLTPLLMGLILLLMFPGVSLSGGDWQRLIFIFCMFLLYISVFFALGIFVSALTARTAVSFLILLFFWIAFVIVIPGASVVAAEHIRPVPASSLLAGEKALFWVDVSAKADEERNKKINETIARYQPRMDEVRQRYQKLYPSGTVAPAGYTEEMSKLNAELNVELGKLSEARMLRITDEVTANNIQLDREYQLKKDAQQSLAKNISRISPASSLTFGSMLLARTGIEEYNRFVSATRIYRPVYRRWMSSLLNIQRTPTGVPPPIDENIISSIPRLPFAPESLGELLMRTLPDFALMTAMTIIFISGAFFAFFRYDVR